MKMSDVFELPLTVSDVIDAAYDESWTQSKLKSAAHAINMHDDLVDAVDVLLNHPDLAHRGAIRELLTRAKGEAE